MEKRNAKRSGVTLIELVIAIGLVVIIFGGISLSYSSILESITATELRGGAASVLARQMEIIRNLPYGQVGTVGGIPSGVIPQQQTSTWNQVEFLLTTTVRNIDDPFDGTLTSNPRDTAPADYKLVEVTASCPSCARFLPLPFTTTVAPKNLESTSNNGSLFVTVIDASGVPVSDAVVNVQNASVTPSISLTDTTNLGGQLQLVGVPTSTQGYKITVNRTGYSSDRTYPPGGAENPNPLKPDATVAANTLTDISFAVDKVSTLNVRTSDVVCAASPNRNFSITGAKLIGTSPDVVKFSTSSATNASGIKTFSNMEWDTYAVSLNESALDVVGTIPLSPVTINPSSTVDFRFVVQSSAPRSLLVTVKDAGTGTAVLGASVALSKSGFSQTLLAGRNFLTHTDWSSDQYSSQSGGIAVGSPAGSLNLVAPYPTSTTHWLISNTFDVGGTSSTFYGLAWLPTSQPPLAGSESVKFQVASNNDNATWNFVGPDGTPSTFYAQPSSSLAAVHTNNRYLRYKAYLTTQDGSVTPQVDEVKIEFSGVCVPASQVLFVNLDLDTYSLTVAAPGYSQATSSVSITGNWQQAEVLLSP